jgi:transposase
MKDRVLARLLPPESVAIETLSQEVGISVTTLERWRGEALTRPARERAWSAAGRLEAVVATAALDEAGQSAWCREHGCIPANSNAGGKARPKPLPIPVKHAPARRETRADRKRIKELERELLRKDKALAETAALLVLSKKLSAIFPGGADE